MNRIKCLEFVFINRRLKTIMFTYPPVKFAMQTKCITKFVLEKKLFCLGLFVLLITISIIKALGVTGKSKANKATQKLAWTLQFQ